MATRKQNGRTAPDSLERSPSAPAIREQLERILSSADFVASKRLRGFLRFVVEETLSGNSHTLKGYTIATKVFGRGEDFDGNVDPVVRIEAGRLRRLIERYYLVDGRQDRIGIEIPKGGYVPTFTERTGEPVEVSGGEEDDAPRSEALWPSIVVQPFRCLPNDPEVAYIGIGLATEIALEIARFQEVRVVLDTSQGGDAIKGDARFLLGGHIFKDRTWVKVNVNLTDRSTGEQLWADTHRSETDASQLVPFQEEVAQVVAAKTTGAQGIIIKTLSKESRYKTPSKLSTYQAILRYHECDLKLTPDTFGRAIKALEYALKTEPDCGQVWSMAGRLYGTAYGLDVPGFERALPKAVEYAETGIKLNPESQRARFTLALIRLYSSELPSGLIEIEKALALNPNSLFFIDVIGYVMMLLGEWDRGRALVERAIKLNPYYNLVIHGGLWIDYIRQENYQLAYQEALNYKRPHLFWTPLGMAVTLAHLGDLESGRKAAEELLRVKPDFPSRGRDLIRRYVKFDIILDRMVEGLSKVGLELQ